MKKMKRMLGNENDHQVCF